jgi:hypothetical protein
LQTSLTDDKRGTDRETWQETVSWGERTRKGDGKPASEYLGSLSHRRERK